MLSSARRPDLPLVAGAFATGLAVGASAHFGDAATLAAVVTLSVFLAALMAFVVVPHVAVAVTIPLFALIPALKVLAFPWIGPLKDLIVLAGAAAAGLVVVRRAVQGERQRIDIWAPLLVGMLITIGPSPRI